MAHLIKSLIMVFCTLTHLVWDTLHKSNITILITYENQINDKEASTLHIFFLFHFKLCMYVCTCVYVCQPVCFDWKMSNEKGTKFRWEVDWSFDVENLKRKTWGIKVLWKALEFLYQSIASFFNNLLENLWVLSFKGINGLEMIEFDGVDGIWFLFCRDV